MSTIEDIEKLAAQVVKDALAPDTAITDRIDALKTLTPIYKLMKGKGDVEDDELGFADFTQAIRTAEETPNGGAKVRGRPGRS